MSLKMVALRAKLTYILVYDSCTFSQLSFGSRILFDSISFDLREEQRIGLIGANGSGKSTLLEAIVGLQHLDGGSITISKNKKIAYLAQDVVLSSTLSILEETMTAFEELTKIQKRLAELEEKLPVLMMPMMWKNMGFCMNN